MDLKFSFSPIHLKKVDNPKTLKGLSLEPSSC